MLNRKDPCLFKAYFSTLQGWLQSSFYSEYQECLMKSPNHVGVLVVVPLTAISGSCPFPGACEPYCGRTNRVPVTPSNPRD